MNAVDAVRMQFDHLLNDNQLQEAERLLEEILNGNDVESYDLDYMKGKLFLCKGEYHEAKNHLVIAKEEQEKELGLADYITAQTTNCLAICLWKTGELHEAAKLFREALSTFRLEEDSNIVNLLCNLSCIESEIRSYDDAIRHLKEAISIQQKKFGEFHQSIAQMKESLGIIFISSGNISDAKSELKLSLSIQKRNNVDNDIKCNTISYLAQAYELLNEYNEARKLLIQALELSKSIYEKDDERTLCLLIRLSFVERKQKSFKESENYLIEALTISEELYGSESKNVAGLNKILGTLYIESKQFDKADFFLKSSLDILLKCENVYIEQASVSGALSDLYAAKENRIKQAKYIQKALFIYNSSIKNKDISYCEEIIHLLRNAGDFYTEYGHLDDAHCIYKELMSICQNVYGEYDQQVKECIDKLADIKYKLKEQKKAKCFSNPFLSKENNEWNVQSTLSLSRLKKQEKNRNIKENEFNSDISKKTEFHCFIKTSKKAIVITSSFFVCGLFAFGIYLYYSRNENK